MLKKILQNLMFVSPLLFSENENQIFYVISLKYITKITIYGSLDWSVYFKFNMFAFLVVQNDLVLLTHIRADHSIAYACSGMFWKFWSETLTRYLDSPPLLVVQFYKVVTSAVCVHARGFAVVLIDWQTARRKSALVFGIICSYIYYTFLNRNHITKMCKSE